MIAAVQSRSFSKLPRVDHQFKGPAYTVGIEEELMILDAESLELVNAIESMIEPAPSGEIKPELMESVLEISTDPCANLSEAGEQLRALRRQVAQTAASKGLAIGSAGTHPFAMWEDQRIVARSRYRELVSALAFVARQELIFGVHVHVGIDDPDKAIHVANGMRVHVPLLLGLSANSPFWRADSTGLASARIPIFRAFPRTGIPPTYESWEDYERRIEFMVKARVIEDYTFLWPDVRPHPSFGTVEVRVMDSQTRVEHTLGLAALVQALARELSEHYEQGKPLSTYPARDARREPVARGPPRPRRRARRPAQLGPGLDPGAGPPADRPNARSLPRPGFAGRARVRRRPA